MSVRNTQACGCWTYYDSNDRPVSSGMCAMHYEESRNDRANPAESQTFTLPQILSYLSAQRDMYASLSRACVPLNGLTASYLRHGEKALASLIEEITIGGLAVHAELSTLDDSPTLATVHRLTHEK